MDSEEEEEEKEEEETTLCICLIHKDQKTFYDSMIYRPVQTNL